MGNSLQDQLLKSGLANKKQAVKARKAKNSREKLQRTGIEVEDENRAAVAAAERAKRERDRELNEEKNERNRLHEISAQIDQLIDLNCVAERGDNEFRFTDGSAIKSMHVKELHRTQLATGVLAIASRNKGYALIPRQVAQKIAQRDSTRVLHQSEVSDEEELDDMYADFKVPDDLMW